MRAVKMVLTMVALFAGLAEGVNGAAQKPVNPSAPTAAPTSDQASEGPVTTIKVFSRLTVVDVTVMDSKGNPVHGLTKDDFTILEDGKPQPIRSFVETGKERPPVQRVPQPLPPHVYSNLQPAPTTSAVNILLLDALNTGPADQVFVKAEMVKYLKNMPPGTRIAIMGLSSRLRLLQGFTSNPDVLLAAINTKKNSALPSPFIDTDSSDALDNAMDLADEDAVTGLQEFQNEVNSFQTDMRNRMTLEALDQIAAYVAGIRGRKNLIWFTAGMPLQMFPEGGVNDMASMTDYSKDLRKTTDLLTAAQVAVYPVDARGLFSNPANSAVNGGGGFASGKGNSMATANAKFLDKTAGEQLGMQAVAEATGGVAYYNTNGLKEAVGKAIENGANYYTISYTPPTAAFDGAYHDINVKVDRKGLSLRYRKGYYSDDLAKNAITPEITLATTAPEPYGNNMSASMGRGVPTSSQILFTVKIDPESPDVVNPPDRKIQGELDPKLVGKATKRYDFSFSMPGKQITFTDTPDGKHKASVEFDIASYDVYGKLLTKLSQTIDLPLSTARFNLLQSQPFRVTQAIDLPVGEQFVRLGILDATSDRVGTVEIPLTVQKKSATPVASPAAAPTGVPAKSGGF
jgi:VWFA-related protein